MCGSVPKKDIEVRSEKGVLEARAFNLEYLTTWLQVWGSVPKKDIEVRSEKGT